MADGVSVLTHPTNFTDLDLQFCSNEPIRIPGSIQPHGVLIAVDPETHQILQVSENVAQIFNISAEDALGKDVASLFVDRESAEAIAKIAFDKLGMRPTYLRTLTHHERRLYVLAHLSDDLLIMEFEVVAEEGERFFRELHEEVTEFISRLSGLDSALEVARVAAEQVRELTKFDRVLVYQFDEEWNGTVIAESRNDVLPSYLDLRFPASDIPAQARELYRLNPTRLIPRGDYEPARIVPELNPRTNQPLDLTFAALRSVSPIHREYMANMGTAASMSISILRHGQLWGLISCHSKEARHVSFDVRKSCEFIGQVVSVQMEAHERNAVVSESVRLKTLLGKLLAYMARHENFADGLVDADESFLEFAKAEGGVVLHDGHCVAVGHTPNSQTVDRIVEWLSKNAPLEDVFHTDRIGDITGTGDDLSLEFGGMLAIRISKLHNSFVLWFRPEVVQTVRWGGDPTKPVDGTTQRVHPRKSFEQWKEVVRKRSLPFTFGEIEAAVEFRNAVVGIVLRRAEEMAQITAQLRRSNKELESFSYSVSHDLRAPFRHIVGYSELLREREAAKMSPEGLRYVENIIESAQFAGTLVDNLLNFSRMARASLSKIKVSMRLIAEETIRDLESDAKGRPIEWKMGALPTVIADPIFLRMALQNLLSNSIKFTAGRDPAVIEITGESRPNEDVIRIKDNGVGFDPRYSEKLFGVFQRLHRIEEFQGTGIGLANVRRIIERHGGRTWAEGELGRGAAFYFSLPCNESNGELA